MKYINGLDSANAEATCPKDERVAWAVPPKCDKVLVITVKSGIIRCYDEGGGIFSLPMPKVEPRPKRNCDRFANGDDAFYAFDNECKLKRIKPCRAGKKMCTGHDSIHCFKDWLCATVAEGGES